MWLKRFLYLAIFSLMAVSVHAALSDDELDEEAIQFEKQKRLEIIDTSKEERELQETRYEIDRESDRYDAENGYDFSEFALWDDFSETGDFVAGREFPPQVTDWEKDIREEVKRFIDSNKTHGKVVRKIWNRHVRHCTAERKNFWPSDVAEKIADHFGKQKNIALATKFYNIAMMSDQCRDYLFLSIASLYIDYINDILRTERPGAPNAAIFTALTEAIRYNSYDPGDGDVGTYGEARNICLRRHRDKMVRWPLAPQKIVTDAYYAPSQLAHLLYGKNFVERLLKSVDDLKELFSLRRFDASNSDKNIFVFLEKRGFIGIRGNYQGAPQYILVNENGLMVRVKRNKDNQQWQYTLGLLLKKPFIWNKDGVAVRAIKPSEITSDGSQFAQDSKTYDFITDFQENEVIKISYHDGLVQLVPSSFFRRCIGNRGRFNVDYWADYSQNSAQMNAAHYGIAPVGKFDKKTGRIDSKAIDKYCPRIDKLSGTILY